jgi:hypothetical protein
LAESAIEAELTTPGVSAKLDLRVLRNRLGRQYTFSILPDEWPHSSGIHAVRAEVGCIRLNVINVAGARKMNEPTTHMADAPKI